MDSMTTQQYTKNGNCMVAIQIPLKPFEFRLCSLFAIYADRCVHLIHKECSNR